VDKNEGEEMMRKSWVLVRKEGKKGYQEMRFYTRWAAGLYLWYFFPGMKMVKWLDVEGTTVFYNSVTREIMLLHEEIER
jgi:hypothetical protein